jgi:DNA repair protein RadC
MVITRVDHDGAFGVDPNYRHQLKSGAKFTITSQILSGIIRLVHNHPSGDPTPSRADIDMTKTIIDTAKPLGITVHDHVIIGKNGHVSFRALRLI